jgi:plasmid stabilization system protein ParE
MKQYDVKISHAALNDMEQIYSYIADRLLEPDTAMGQYNRIAEAIQSLNILPERCALVESEPERTQGLRWTTTRYSTSWARMTCRWPVCCTVHPTLCAVCGE